MKLYFYHYHAIFRKGGVTYKEADGLLTLRFSICSSEIYQVMRADIANTLNCNSEDVIINSLTLVGEAQETDTVREALERMTVVSEECLSLLPLNMRFLMENRITEAHKALAP